MKLLVLIAIGLIAVQTLEVKETLHHLQHILDEENETISEIFPLNDDDNVENKYSKFINSILSFKNQDIITCTKGDSPDFFKFLAIEVGRLGTPNDPESIVLDHRSDDCFENMEVTYEKNTDENQIIVQFNPGKQANGCREAFLLGTTMNYNIVTMKKQKSHRVVFKHLNDKEMQAFDTYGLHIFRTCDTIAHFLPDLLLTVELFFGGFSSKPYLGPIFGSKPSPWMEKANKEFYKHGMNYDFKDRKNVFVDLDETEVHSGDFLAITRFDGLDQIIGWGTGSVVGHTCVLLEIDGEMHVIESQDAWYWPKQNIQKNTWKQWKKNAKNAGFNVALLPLSPEKRAQFDSKKALDFFLKMEGYPYGYHNFMFGWIDTVKDNYPDGLDIDFAMQVFSILEKIDKPLVTQFVGEALNKRLGTEGLSVPEIAIETARQGKSFGELFAMVEKDEWIYSDGPSMVCSSFVIAVYKAAGLFGDLEIQATEFGPRDLYLLNFFDKNYEKPEKCQQADPTLPYCQIMGTHLMELPDYGTIDPYDHMNENCPSVGPLYIRPDGC